MNDTLLGFFLEPFHTSVRKQLKSTPKFYFYDAGVTRAFAQMLTALQSPATSYYGELFEQMVVAHIAAQNSYKNNDYRMSYLRTKSDVEVDIVLQRPGKNLALIEIKSKKEVTSNDAKSLKLFQADFPNAELFLFSQDPTPKLVDRIRALPWITGLAAL